MVWPFSAALRPLVRAASWFLGADWGTERIEAQLERRHDATAAEAAQALPEARRGVRFMEIINTALSRGRNLSFAQLWALQARNVFRSGYGRAPTQQEMTWAYTQPQGTLGLWVQVFGRGAWTGRYVSKTLSVNVAWTARMQDVIDYVVQSAEQGGFLELDLGSEPLVAGSVGTQLRYSALLAHHRPTLPQFG